MPASKKSTKAQPASATNAPAKVAKRSRSAITEVATRGLLDSKRLFYFFHVAKSGSISAAEAALDVAQPAITRQIQHLESDVGEQLLQRTGRGVLLTAAGQILFRHAESIFDNMSQAIEELDIARRNPIGRLSIATPPSFSSMYMPEVIRCMLRRLPDIELSVFEASTGQVHDYLVSGQVDLAVVIHAPNSHKLALRKISTEPLCLIAHHEHELAGQEFVTRAQLQSLQLIVPANLHGSRQLMEAYFGEGGQGLKAALQIDSLAITKAVVAQGPRYCSILPQRSCQPEIANGDFVALPLKPTLQRTLHLARMRDRPETPYAREMAEQIAAVLQERTGQGAKH